MLKIIETTPIDFGQTLALDMPLSEIAKHILSDGAVYCIKHCIHKDAIDALRRDVFDHFEPLPQIPINYDDAALMHGNYHSIERGVSRFQKTLHYFHAYLFNDLNGLPPALQPRVTGLFQTLVALYNGLTSSKRELTVEHADKKRFRPQLFQYHCGGGMFAAHSHLLEPQKIGLILGFSQRGRDFVEGGAGFEAPGGAIIDTSDVHDIGDIVLFRYDMKHWVSPCDIKSPLSDDSPKGRWSAVIPIY